MVDHPVPDTPIHHHGAAAPTISKVDGQYVGTGPGAISPCSTIGDTDVEGLGTNVIEGQGVERQGEGAQIGPYRWIGEEGGEGALSQVDRAQTHWCAGGCEIETLNTPLLEIHHQQGSPIRADNHPSQAASPHPRYCISIEGGGAVHSIDIRYRNPVATQCPSTRGAGSGE